MLAYLISFAVGLGVGVLYASINVRSPAPPLIALAGLLGMVLGEQAFGMMKQRVADAKSPSRNETTLIAQAENNRTSLARLDMERPA